MGFRRVVVTGLGAVTPLGNTMGEYWDNLLAGANGIGPITRFDASAYGTRIAAEVKGLNGEDHFDKKEVRRLDLFVQYAVISAREAWADAGFTPADTAVAADAGAFVGVGMGGIGTLHEQVNVLEAKGPNRVSPFLIPKMIPNMAAGMVSIHLGLKGPNLCTTTACASAAHAIGAAMRSIQFGECSVAVAGGSESPICPVAVAGFGNMQALSTRNDDPDRASRPFDADRDGFVIGEGAGILILEELEHALARGARIYCEMLGYGYSGDAYHMTAPSPGGEGGARAIAMALRGAGLSPADVQYVNAHGTSTPLNDRLETEAIRSVFGEHAAGLAVSSNKSMIGHLCGAAGAAEAVATVKTIETGMIPPTRNHETADEGCDLDYVPGVARKADVRNAISNSLGFGGHNCTLCFGRMREA